MEHLFPELLSFYDEFAAESKNLRLEEADCGECGKCCQGPPFLMTTSDLEYRLIQNYIRENRLPFRIHFKAITADQLDRREGYLAWTCPLYTKSKGCEVYPVRPFACRILGPLSHDPGLVEYCAFKNPRLYTIPPEIPLWSRYAGILRQYDFKRGYFFPDQVLYNSPILEFLMEFPVPWSRWTAFPF